MMKKLALTLAGALVLVLGVLVVPADAGTTYHFKNCGPGKAVLIHWHNKKKGFVDIWWTLSTATFPGSAPKAQGTFAKGNHSTNTGQNSVYYGIGSAGLKSVDKLWVTCTSAF